MTLTRRGFVKAAGAFAGLGLLPSWKAFRQRRQIDLTPFCDDDFTGRYSISQPFAQDGMVYATDARILCRTTLADVPELADGARLPAASQLPWWRQTDVAWKPWPKLRLIADDWRKCKYDAICPFCRGKGCFGRITQCEVCFGYGDVPDVKVNPNEWDGIANNQCTSCRGSGYVSPDGRCGYCDGSGDTPRPAYQRVGSLVVAGHYDQLVRGLGDVEFAICQEEPFPATAPGSVVSIVKFRGDGFEGLLMPIDTSA